MSFKKITDLRKNGQLNEALEMVEQELRNNPDDIWCKRAAAWVYYDFVKKSVVDKDYDALKSNLVKIKDLGIGQDDKMVFDQVAWQIGKYLFSVDLNDVPGERKEELKGDNGAINALDLVEKLHESGEEIFVIIANYHFTRPSDSYSFLMKSYLKFFGKAENNSFLSFADWWGLDNFTSDDYTRRKTTDGKSYLSLAEQVYITYAKIILKGKKPDEEAIELDHEKINDFIKRLNDVIISQPGWEYAIYYKSKLLLAIGNRNDARETLIPFARKKKSEFWAWDLLSDTFEEEDENRLACLCKSASCDADPKMKRNVMGKLAETLKKQDYDDITISGLSRFKEENKGKKDLQILVKSEKYKKWIMQAEDILFEDIAVELAVVEFVNTNKKILNFVVSKEKAGFFKYDRFLEKVKPGDVLKVRLEGSGINRRYNPYTVENTDEYPDEDVYKEFEGEVRKRDDQPFGFLEDVFIDPGMIRNNYISDGDILKVVAIISYNKKKDSWGWKAIRVNN